MSQALKTAVARQRMLLHGRLEGVVVRLATCCRSAWGDRSALEARLGESLPALPSCRYVYLLDQDARQVTANIARHGALPEHHGRDRSQRPYLAEALAGRPFLCHPPI
jgi:hypothetical protein